MTRIRTGASGRALRRLFANAADTTNPTAPTLSYVLTGQTADLSWTGATDNVGVTQYRIYRDGSLVTTQAGTTYSDSPASGTYVYKVTAGDAAGNWSVDSNTVSVVVPPAPGTAFSSDSFTDTSGTVITSHTSDTSHTWAIQPTNGGTSRLSVSPAGRLYYSTAGSLPFYMSSVTPPSADYLVEVEIRNLGGTIQSSTRAGVMARANASGALNGYYFEASYTISKLLLVKYVNGAATTLYDSGALSAYRPALNTTMKLGLKVQGSTITVYKDGTQMFTGTDTTYATAGRLGIAASASVASTNTESWQLDNFKASYL